MRGLNDDIVIRHTNLSECGLVVIAFTFFFCFTYLYFQLDLHVCV